MNPRFDRLKPFGFTLLELLVLIAVIAILAALLLPTGGGPRRAFLAVCLNNQRQIATGLVMFADDHQGTFPAPYLMETNRSVAPYAVGEVVPLYLAITNYVRAPSRFLCPSDKKRREALAGQPFARTNASYFISIDASPTNAAATTILTGDRHLATDGKPVEPGLFFLSSSQSLSWTSELHAGGRAPIGGAFTFVDGHGELVSSAKLSKVVARQGTVTNRVAIP